MNSNGTPGDNIVDILNNDKPLTSLLFIDLVKLSSSSNWDKNHDTSRSKLDNQGIKDPSNANNMLKRGKL